MNKKFLRVSYCEKNMKFLLITTVQAICITILICFSNFTFNNQSFTPGGWIFSAFSNSMKNQPTSLYFVMSLIGCVFVNKIHTLNNRCFSKEIEVFNIAFSLFFALMFICGKSYQYLSNWDLVFSSKNNLIFCICIICIISVSICRFLYIGWIFLTCLMKKDSYFEYSWEYGRKVIFLFIAIELLYIIAYFPGTANFDGLRQLTVYYGFAPLVNHHPIISTFIMGSVFNIGSKLGDYNFGLLLWTLMQVIFQIYVFLYAIRITADLTHSKICTYFMTLFLVINPIFAIWGIHFVKDTTFYIAFLWFMLNLIVILELNVFNYKGMAVKLFASIVLMCLFRHNGFILVIPTLILVLVLKYKDISLRKIIEFNVVMIFLLIILMPIGFRNFGIKPQPVTETLFVPFQQTARLYKERRKIEEIDKHIMEEVFGNKDLSKIYNPEFADPVKNSFINKGDNLQRYRYFYFKYLFRYPTTYIQALLNQSYGYFYPFRKIHMAGEYGIIQKQTLRSDIIKLEILSPFDKLRKFLSYFPEVYQTLPILNFYYNCSFYIWILLFIIGIIIVKKKIRILIFSIPLVLSIAICVVSPVNAYIRYMLPIMAVFPLFIIYSVYSFIGRVSKNE